MCCCISLGRKFLVHAMQEEQWVSHNRDHGEKWEIHSQKPQYLIWSEAVANGLWEKCFWLVSLPQPLLVRSCNRSSGI